MIELLVQARKDAGLTQAELGARIGQRQTFVSKVELGERRLDAAVSPFSHPAEARVLG
jgi:transcriptional regulator with XRE-family HTH domain